MVCQLHVIETSILHMLTLPVAEHRRHDVMVNSHVEAYVTQLVREAVY